MAFNRNKRSLALDLKREGGREVLRRLLGRADVFVQSLRAGAIEELGLDFARATALNPRLVYCSITAFGTRGPLSGPPGLRPADAGLRRHHVGQRPPGPGARAGAGRRSWTWAPACGRRSASWPRCASATAPAAARRGDDRALRDRARCGSSYHAMGYYWRYGRGPAAAGLGHRDDRALPGVSRRRRLGDDRRRLGRAVRQRLTEALGVPELAARSALRGQSFARRPVASRWSRRSRRAPARSRPPICSSGCARPACPPRPSTDGPGAAVSRRPRPAECSSAPTHPRVPDYRAIGLPISGTASGPAVRRVPPLLGEHTAEVLTGLGYDEADHPRTSRRAMSVQL